MFCSAGPSVHPFMPSELPTHYTPTAKVLHWLVAGFAFAQLSLGTWMIQIPKSPPGVRASWFNLHKSIGLTLGLVILLRLAWRLTHRAPPLPETIPAWQRTLAKVCHFMLYVCLVVIPLSGYLGSSFTSYPIKYFGHTLPQWGWESPALKDRCSQVHLTAIVIFVVLIALHLAAVLKHLFVDRDEIFQRMGWTRRGREPGQGGSAPGPLP
ncbi:MAG: cytochrome b [Opitutus sp.]|nr:cytochrome b [Opitutus sp.]